MSKGPGRVPALDGLRGIAVLAVLAFHAWPALFPGGFVGVDMFFVLSGFLITVGLVRQIDSGHGVNLGSFWMRRIRRLVPALILALVGSTALAWLAVSEFPAGLRREWLGALTYTSNWLMIVDGNDYFNAATPPLFEHLWSLAIEEQFYVVWPLLILGILLLCWPRKGTARSARGADALRMGIVLALAIASAVGMAVGQLSGAPTTRMYFGTDTHAFGLLFGATVALALTHVARPEQGGRKPATGTVRTGLAWAGLAILTVSFFVVDGTAAYTYLGVLALLSALVALLVLHVVQGNRRDSLSRAMSGDFLGWWGRRSYGAYLWHWPLLVIMRVLVPADAPQWVEPLAAGLVVILTALIAEASARIVEEPILHHGFRATFRSWGKGIKAAWTGSGVRAGGRGRAGRRAAGAGKAFVAVGAAALLAVPVAAGAALVHSPSQTKLQQEIAAAEDALREAEAAQESALAEASAAAESQRQKQEDSGGSAEPSSGEDGSADPSAGESAPPSGDELGVGDPQVLRPEFTEQELSEDLPPSVHGPDIALLGDSVSLSAAPELLKQMPGIHIDAEVGNQLRDAADQLAGMAANDTLRPVTVIALGANGSTQREDWDRILATLGEDRLLVLVIPHGPPEWVPGVQQQMTELSEQHREQVVVADWDHAAQYVREFAPDKVHPRQNGQQVFAQLIRRTIDERLGVDTAER
ncbi:acyltransferase family protein [Micrococcus luteus]